MSTVHSKSTYSRSDNQYHRVFKYNDPQHTPYNKRPYEEVSNMELIVNAHIRSMDWLEIRTEEFRTNKNKDVRSVCHAITLNKEQVIALRDMLNEQFPI